MEVNMGSSYYSRRNEKRGKEVIDDILSGRIDNFEKYTFKTVGETQLVSTRASQIGSSVVKVLQSIEDEELVEEVVAKIFKTEKFKFIEVFRVAQDLGTKIEKYEGSKKMKNSYLLMHPDVREGVYDLSLWLAVCLNRVRV